VIPITILKTLKSLALKSSLRRKLIHSTTIHSCHRCKYARIWITRPSKLCDVLDWTSGWSTWLRVRHATANPSVKGVEFAPYREWYWSIHNILLSSGRHPRDEINPTEVAFGVNVRESSWPCSCLSSIRSRRLISTLTSTVLGTVGILSLVSFDADTAACSWSVQSSLTYRSIIPVSMQSCWWKIFLFWPVLIVSSIASINGDPAERVEGRGSYSWPIFCFRSPDTVAAVVKFIP